MLNDTVGCQQSEQPSVDAAVKLHQPAAANEQPHSSERTQESCAIAKMSARCTIRQYAHGPRDALMSVEILSTAAAETLYEKSLLKKLTR